MSLPNTYRFRLDNRRPTRLFYCPQCRKRSFKRYIDTQTDTFLAEEVGRCNRENSCGYHYTPKQFFAANPSKKLLEVGSPLYKDTSNFQQQKPSEPPVFDTIPKAIVAQTLQHYDQNHFVVYLRGLFGESLTANLCKRFCIGTAKKWQGATIFWQCDLSGNFRTGEIKLYNSKTGKRDKTKNHWAHCLMSNSKIFVLQQCLFGLHQLLYEPLDKPIALVESPKTAVILSAIYPKYIWLATNGAYGIADDKMRPLHGRTIRLFPDTDEKPYKKWQLQCRELQKQGFNVTLSTLLYDRLTPEQRTAGYDLADAMLHRCPQFGWQLSDEGYPLFWD